MVARLLLEHPCLLVPPRLRGARRDLVRILIGETISEVGSQVGSLALPFGAALTLQATPGQMAVLGITEYVPPIVVGLVAGAWIDRQRRRPLLIGANLARALLLVLVAVATATHTQQFELLYGAGIVLGALEMLFATAFVAYLPSLVSQASLIPANSALATTTAAADVVGPALAGVLIQTLGTAAAMAVDGGSFLASVVGLAFIRTAEPAPQPRPLQGRLSRELVDGWRFLFGNPVLRAFTLTDTRTFLRRTSER